MSQYYTDFSEYADLTALLAAWTPTRWVTTGLTLTLESDVPGATGGKVMRCERAAVGRTLISWDVLNGDAGRAAVDVLIRYRTSAGNNAPGAGVRGSGSAANESGYGLVQHLSSSGMRINRYVAGAFTLLTQPSVGALDPAVWYWMRARANGSTLSIKRWEGAVGDEPGTWAGETTDDNITAAGWVGAIMSGALIAEYDVFAVGTNGDLAPTEPVVTAPTITNVPNMTIGTQATITGTGFGA